MPESLKVAENLRLPLEAVTSTFGIFAMRGVGKTHSACVMAEEMLKVGQPVVIYDPTGAWYGLKSSADGKRAGFPVVIFGGDHADVPLEETAGETIARVIVERRCPAILDCSLLRKNARMRFMTQFCEAVYRLNRQPLHLFLDEVHTLAPREGRGMAIDRSMLIGAVEDIILQGRRKGLGCTVISQRPALVHTNVRTQCETLIAMRVVAKHDINAIGEWVEVHATIDRAKEMIASLPRLPIGEAWVWSPAFLDLFQRVRFRQRETFDSSATPKVGQRVAIPKVLAAIDLEALGEQIKATVAQAKADNPSELRRQLAEMRKTKDAVERDYNEVIASLTASGFRLVKVGKALTVIPRDGARSERVAKPVLKDEQIERLRKITDRFIEIGREADTMAAKVAKALTDAMQPYLEAGAAAANVLTRPLVPAPPRFLPAKPKPSPRAIHEHSDGDLLGQSGKRRIMIALAQHYPEAITDSKLSLLSGVGKRGGTWRTYVGFLCQHDLIIREGRMLRATEAGIRHLGNYEALPAGRALQEHWLNQCGAGGQRMMLQSLIDAYPESLSAEGLGSATGISPGGGTFRTYLGKLRTLDLVDKVTSNPATYRASPILFD